MTGITAPLSSRAIIGRFYETLSATDTAWVDTLAMRMDSNQESETYKWLGATPVMREWVGGRQAKGFRLNGLTVENKLFEATLKIALDDLRRDKTGQIMTRIDELATRAAQHPARLMTTLIEAGESTACYDGQFFFDTDHTEGDSGTQDNDRVFDISDNATGGTATAPTKETMQRAILQAVQALMGFKDDQGEPMNEGASAFTVMVPTPFMAPTLEALRLPLIGGGDANLLAGGSAGFSLTPRINPRLSWTTKFAVFRTDGRVKPFIHQVDFEPRLDSVAEGSELEFQQREHHYGVTASRNVAYGYWQHACLVTLQA
jgi:phage major head subunit gpT-like protein